MKHTSKVERYVPARYDRYRWGIRELVIFQEHSRDYKISVIKSWRVKAKREREVYSPKRINL